MTANPANRAAHEPHRRDDDRLTTALVLAAAVHLIVLLGVGFAPPAARDSPAESLEVVIVHDPLSDPRDNPQADYLADVTQRGGGTGTTGATAQAPGGVPSGADGRASGGGKHADSAANDDVVARAGDGTPAAIATARAAGAVTPLVVESLQRDNSSLDTGDRLALRGEPHQELAVTANTRESSVAVYLDAWRHRIERIGTANYPLDALRAARLSGNPVLEVRIGADGRLVDAVVSRSSGHLALDQAALTILRLAAPFEPFPAALAARHDALRLTYEWQFTDGHWDESRVRLPADTR